MKRATILTIAAAALAACSSPDRSGYTDMPAHGWVYGDSVAFTPEPSDSSVVERASVAVAVRHTNGYEYSNLWLELRYTGADSVHTDTVNLRLADEYGHWYGTGPGVSYQYIDTVLRDVEIDRSRPLVLRHIMRCDTLSDIEQVGIFYIPD